MIDVECSVVVGDQRALLGSVDEPVVPDASVEGEQALSDPHEDAEVGPAAVRFEPELALEGVVDGLDALPDPAQLAVASALVAPIRSDQPASSERLTVSREAPQGTGVESSRRSRSHQEGLRRARWRTACARSLAAARRRRL